MVACPICQRPVREIDINRHIDSDCASFVSEPSPPATQIAAATPASGVKYSNHGGKPPPKASQFFTPAAKRNASFQAETASSPLVEGSLATSAPDPSLPTSSSKPTTAAFSTGTQGNKRTLEDDPDEDHDANTTPRISTQYRAGPPPSKKSKPASHAPLAERMRPRSLSEVAGQHLVGPNGILRSLILTDRVPSMILWGGPGTGKTTIARLIAQTAGTRFVEINSTSSGVGECKKIFAEARNELGLTGRKTIIFCDEIHRFSKSQQDVFLGPVEAGTVTLIGATTENPSFKVVNALLSRCRTFTLEKLGEEDVFAILKKALERERPELREDSSMATPSPSPSDWDGNAGERFGKAATIVTRTEQQQFATSHHLLTADSYSLLHYLSTFADGDARTALNLLELALDLCAQPNMTSATIKSSLTQTLVYDRAGDQHYDTISAFHKSVRGSSPDAALYYLARMLQSGEDPLYVARRMVVMASEDIGLADNTMLSLATAAYAAAEKIGMPECRINLAHCAVALALAPKSVRAYRGLNEAYRALSEPGVAGLPVPVHLRNAPTKLMKELGYGKEYKYNPDYVDGRVVQEYLPEKLVGRKFLGARHLGETIDLELQEQASDRAREGADAEVDVEEPANLHVDDEDDALGENEQELLLGPDGD